VPLPDSFGSRSITVTLAPEMLSAVVRSGKRIVAHSEIKIGAARADGSCANALTAFRAYLGRTGLALRGVPISVVISTRWCQLTMLPWSDALLLSDSALYYRHAHFAAIYGDVARNWDIVCDDAPYGQPRLACAIERDFLNALRDCARANGHPWASVESLLSTAARAAAPGRQQALAVIEPGRVVMASFSHGRISAVQAQACRGAWHAELPPAWQHWMLRAAELGDVAQVALISLGEPANASTLPSRDGDATFTQGSAALANNYSTMN
jgi:hypothetical protein